MEDHSDAYLLLLRLLDSDYELRLAVSAEQALHMAEEEHFDLVLLDINLGQGPDGRHLLRELRKRPEYVEVPVIACTAYAMPGDDEKLLAEGFDAYIGKPYRKKVLLETVRGLLMETENARIAH